MRRIVYTGPHDAITIPALPGVVVRRGEPISTSPELTESLLRQSTWAEVQPPATRKPAVKSTTTSTASAVEEASD